MRVVMEGSQEEFDSKRFDILKAISGGKFKIEENTPIRRAYFTAQNEMMDFYDKDFRNMMISLKKDVEAVLDGKL